MYSNGGSYVIPEGIKTIKEFACHRDNNNRLISLPGTIRNIEQQDYRGDEIFSKPPTEALCTTNKLSGDGMLRHIDKYWMLSKREWAAICLFQSDKQFDDICAKHMTDKYEEYIDEMMPLLDGKRSEKFYQKAAGFIIKHISDINKECIRSFCKFVSSQKMTKTADMLQSYLDDDNDLIASLRKQYNEIQLDEVIKKNKGNTKKIANVKLAGSKKLAPEFLVKCAIVPYLEQYEGRPKYIEKYKKDYITVKIVESADMAAKMLNRTDLLSLLSEKVKQDCSAWSIPYGRYADGRRIASLISNMKKWEKWYEYGRSGRGNIIIARGTLMLSDTREAMMYLEKNGLLDNYAKLRNADIDSIRDTVLADFGLDENGKKEYDLGSKKVEISVGQDLSLVVYDKEMDKFIKSIPKKGADPESYEAAKADFAEIKKNIKKVIKSRNDSLFGDFLSGRTRTADSWMNSYTKNMVLRRVVWNQGSNTFILTEDGAVNCEGQAYEIKPDVNIGLAHPMEMTRDDVEAWQKYFTSHNLKQPFAQIWEPVIDPATIKSSRYKECMIPYYRFANHDKHGIAVKKNTDNYPYTADITFEDCDAVVERITWQFSGYSFEMDDDYEVTEISFKKYTRRVNHIIAYLDKVTTYTRILQNDASIMDCLSNFTLSQIMEFIHAASENNCANSLSVLLDYKNTNFAEYNPMDEFILD